jgi:DNA-binding NarL/FixJ family response regulator
MRSFLRHHHYKRREQALVWRRKHLNSQYRGNRPMPAEKAARCPLSPALLQLLQVCVSKRCCHDQALADYLHVSPHTIHTEFKLISRLLQTHDRFASVLVALQYGWITLPPPRK